MTCINPCDGCAFTKGSEANREPYNALKAQLCLLGGLPFYCHHNLDWRKAETHEKKPRRVVREMDICGGWKREVAALARAGYFKTHRLIKRAYAQIGLGALETFASETDKREKATAKKALRGVIEALVKERDQSERGVAHEIDPGQ